MFLVSGIALVLLVLCALPSIVFAENLHDFYVFESDSENNCTWDSESSFLDKSLNMNSDDDDDDSDFTYSYFSSSDATETAVLECRFSKPVDLSTGQGLRFWMNLENVAGINKSTHEAWRANAFLIMVDANDIQRPFWNLPQWFGLEDGTWAKVIVDPSNYVQNKPGFDPGNVKSLRITFVNGGDSYSQTTLITDAEVVPGLFDVEYHAQLAQRLNIANAEVVPELFDSKIGSDRSNFKNEILTSMIVYLSSSVIMGYFLLKIIRYKLNFGFVINFSLYSAFGLVLLILLAIFLAMLHFTQTTVLTAFFSFMMVGSYLIFRDRAKILSEIKNEKVLPNLIAGILIILSLTHFFIIAENMNWPPVFDPQYHGHASQFIMYHTSVFNNNWPFFDLPYGMTVYPQGFHALTAFFSLITNVMLPISQYAVTVTIVALLPPICFSIIYKKTKSYYLASIAFGALFFIPGNEVGYFVISHDVLLTIFSTGTFVFATFTCILLLFISIVINNKNNSNFIIYSLLSVVIFITYTIMIVPFVLFIIIKLILLKSPINSKTNGLRVGKFKIKNYMLILRLALIILVVTSGASLVYFADELQKKHNLDIDYAWLLFEEMDIYNIDSIYFPYFILLLGGVLSAIWLFKSNREFSLFLIVMFSLVFGTISNKVIFENLFWFMYPDRLVLLGAIISQIGIILAGVDIFDKLATRFNKREISLRSKSVLSIAICSLVFIALTPSLDTHISYEYDDDLLGYLPTSNELKVMGWMNDNLDSNTTILEDRTGEGMWLSSIKIFDITNNREMWRKIHSSVVLDDTFLKERAYEANLVLHHPGDMKMMEILDKYGIEYVLITGGNPRDRQQSEVYQLLPVFPALHISTSERIALFEDNPQLQLVIREGEAALFKVKT